MRRREFITLLGGTVVAWPLAVRAQQPTMPVIGFLNSASPGPFAHFLAAFHQGLKETGFVEGQNVTIEYRWADGQYDRLPALAADLVRRQVTVIAATGGPPAALAAKAATTTVPIVFVASDALRLGLITNLSRPTGNMTGVSALNYEIEVKKLEVLSEVIPKPAVIGVLVNPTNQNSGRMLQDIQAAAIVLNRIISVVNASNERDLDPAFTALVQQKIGAVVVATDTFFVSRIDEIAAIASRHALAAISEQRGFSIAGGLMSYGADLADAYFQAGIYTGKILKGTKPAELPVMQATKVNFIINLKTARSLGVTIPLPLVGRADEVIE
jgi:putative tryptophan/tyrosine transport system substrate-binding protein